eukprot:TRINITY_DN57445_c0_g1_i1.p1 TRINITY_DN57445_c0_g1~~TRINITY_DN57445_c0_g1_i1.p1  ORF type:complete len:607 (+),score=257.86 TRINITY_DN57445_c0_g1_i1:45-1865(+)
MRRRGLDTESDSDRPLDHHRPPHRGHPGSQQSAAAAADEAGDDDDVVLSAVAALLRANGYRRWDSEERRRRCDEAMAVLVTVFGNVVRQEEHPDIAVGGDQGSMFQTKIGWMDGVEGFLRTLGFVKRGNMMSVPPNYARKRVALCVELYSMVRDSLLASLGRSEDDDDSDSSGIEDVREFPNDDDDGFDDALDWVIINTKHEHAQRRQQNNHNDKSSDSDSDDGDALDEIKIPHQSDCDDSSEFEHQEALDLLVRELGFQEEAARRALITAEGDRERAIAIMTAPMVDTPPELGAPPVMRKPSDDIMAVVRRLDAEEAKAAKKRHEEEEKLSAIAIANVLRLEEDNKRRQRHQDDEALKSLLMAQYMAGRPLTRLEANLVLAPDDHDDATSSYECLVCYEDELKLADLALLDECAHYLCSACMTHYVTDKINDGRVVDMACPDPDCDRLIGISEVRRFVDGKTLEKYESFLLDGYLKSDPNARWCLRPGCETAMIGSKDHPMLVCPQCQYTFCFNCEVEWHADSTCEQYQQWKVDNAQGADKYADWAKKNTKPCPKCNVRIEKNGGCNHMKCTSCRHEYCWLCNETYKVGHYALNESHPCYGKQFT